MQTAALLHIRDVNIQRDLYKTDFLKILGFHESQVVDFKNRHPMELTEKMPVMMTSNHSPKEFF